MAGGELSKVFRLFREVIMENITLSYVATMRRKNKPINEIVEMRKYIPIKEKLEAIDEYIKSLRCYSDGAEYIDSFEQYFKFTMLAVKMYTNIKIEGTYEEYDILVKNGLLNDIFGYVQEDYSDFQSIMKMKLNDYMRK